MGNVSYQSSTSLSSSLDVYSQTAVWDIPHDNSHEIEAR